MLSDRKTWAGALRARCPHKALNLTILLILSLDLDRARGFFDARALLPQTFIPLLAEDCRAHYTTPSNRPAPTRMKVILSIFIAAAAFDPVWSKSDAGICGLSKSCKGVDWHFVRAYSNDCAAESSDKDENENCCTKKCRLLDCHANKACPTTEKASFVRNVEAYCQYTTNPGPSYKDCCADCCSSRAYDECPSI